MSNSPRKLTRSDDRVPDVGAVLADAAGEREDVDAAQGHGHVGHCPGDPVRVDREGERIVEAAEGREPRLVLERCVELVDAQAALAKEVDERARVDRARTRGHGDALERAEAHRRVDRAPVEHCGHRAAAAQVAGHDPRGVELRDHRLHGDPVEPVAAHAPVAPGLRDRVRRRHLGDRRVERRVEDRDVRHVRERGARLADRAQGRRVVERGDARQIVDRLLDPVVDQHRLRVPSPSVHDAMPDGVRRLEAVDGPRLLALDEAELQARRAGIDGEDGAQRVSRARPSRARTARPRRAPASRPCSAAAPRPCPAAAPQPSPPVPARGR